MDDAAQPQFTRRRNGTISREIDEASSELLHSSLDIHLPPTPNRPRAASTSSRTRRRKSVQDLRVPPGFQGAADSLNWDRLASGASSGPREGDALEEEDERANTASPADSPPSSGAPPVPRQLLRRVTSAEDLSISSEIIDDEDGFSSDEEPFRVRPPSIASSNTSQRSSRFGVRVEDRSDRECDAFARDVRIRGFHPVGAQSAGGFVVFDIEITTREGTALRIHRRYSAFVELRTSLVAAFPHLRPLIPRLPPKSSLAKFRTSFLERRRQQLGYWLTTILLHPETGSSQQVRQWVLG